MESNTNSQQEDASGLRKDETRMRRKIVIYTGDDEIIKLHAPRSRWITRTVSFACNEMKRYAIATHCVITDLRSREWVLEAHSSIFQRLRIILFAR